MKILVSCYACSPYKGSEPGMGWNFVQQISLRHESHILVESKFQNDIEKYLALYPEKRANKYFYYITKRRHKLLREIWPPSYYWFYRDWQKKAYRMAMELDQTLHFDLVHQLNMVGYREPGYLWQMDKPMVWGPIGGFNITPWNMLPSMGLKGCVFYFSRSVLNLWQMYTKKRVKKAMHRANALIAATKNEADVIARLYDRNSTVVPEVGFSGKETIFTPHDREKRLKICWCGQFTPGKSLNLLIEAASLVASKVELHILGDGECRAKWERLAAKYPQLPITWYGWVEKDTGMNIMQSCDLFCITSLSDLTSTVLLEALSYGLPVIALDHCGFTNVITDKCGIKIPIRNKDQVVHDISSAIDILTKNEAKRKEMSIEAYQRALSYGWNEKGKQLERIYQAVTQ